MDAWHKAILKKFGFAAKHLNITYNPWIITTWRESDYPELAKNDEHLQSKLDKIYEEIAQTTKKTVNMPVSQQMLLGSASFIAQSKAHNILTLLGMSEMAKRSTGDSNSTNGFHAVGIGQSAETINDTTLEDEVGRKAIGSRTVVNQTERYGSVFNSADVTNPPRDISEAGILTANALGILIMRVTSVPVSLPVGLLLTLQTNVTHQNGIEI